MSIVLFVIDSIITSSLPTKTEKKLLHEIEEARAVIDSVNVDRQIIENYKKLRNKLNKYHLPKKFSTVLQTLKKYKYDDKLIIAEFSIGRSMKKERREFEFNRHILEGRIKK